MTTLDRERDMVISKNIHLSNCNFEWDVADATKRVLNHIETDDFQSGQTKIELYVYSLIRDYTISLYRDWDAMHVWIDWDFAYEVSLNGWRFGHTVRDLFRNWRWVPGIEMIYRWDRVDPQLFWNWIKANYREVEDYLYEDFIDWLKESNKYTQYSKLKKSLQDKKFNDWLFNHYYRIVEIFLQLRDLNEH